MGWREWTGIGERSWEKPPNREVQPGKTLWDWLQLLIVPAILVGVTFTWSASQTRSDNKREDRRIGADRASAEEARQDATLQGYLDQMSGLMLDKKLLTSTQTSAVRAVAHTVTLTALRRLDGDRKAEVVQFLYGANLLQGRGSPPGEPPVSLFDADLERVNLQNTGLSTTFGGENIETRAVGPNLSGANLARANFKDADLGGTDFSGADLSGADLSRAILFDANFQAADLPGADLSGADLTGASLRDAVLEDANLKGAQGLDLDRYITDITELDPALKKSFLDSQAQFLDSLSRKELSKFNLTPEKLAKLRREASGG
jgi:uncharacterized protein YjbI with pentapeptide repeats